MAGCVPGAGGDRKIHRTRPAEIVPCTAGVPSRGEEILIVSFLASTVGAVCGIGGGVIIRSVLDMLHLETVTAISFLSGCIVLSMTCYMVGRSMLAGECRVALRTDTPLAIGAAIGLALGVMSSFFGIGGGIAGRALNRRMDKKTVDKVVHVFYNSAETIFSDMKRAYLFFDRYALGRKDYVEGRR